MILPGPDDAPMQCIDARDMGAWTIRLVEDRTTGVFTAARPATTFGQFLADTVAVVGEPVELVPVDGAFLTEQGVDGAQLPLWSEGAPEQVLAMSTARAEAAGLTHRPFEEVVRDTLAWAQAHPDQATRDGRGARTRARAGADRGRGGRRLTDRRRPAQYVWVQVQMVARPSSGPDTARHVSHADTAVGGEPRRAA